MNSSDGTQTANKFHPEFSHEDENIVLCSTDEIRFLTYKVILRQASGFYRDTLSLPQSSVTGSGDKVTVDFVALDEDGETIADILRMICGRAVRKLDFLNVIEPLLYAAEKYDMPGPISIIREAAWANTALDPFRVYALSCRYGWQDLAKMSSTRTLTSDIADSAVLDKLQRITDTTALMKLLQLHLQRKRDFWTFVGSSA
jgi:hypothetical protein